MDNENLEEIKQALSESLQRENRQPSVGGIWYYVYLKGDNPEWRLAVYPDETFPYAGHDDVWSKYLSILVAKHYKLEKYQWHILKNLAYAMPRGRMGKESGIWYFYHGDDFPSPLDPEHEKRRLINMFHLNLPAAQDKVIWKVAGHEKMNPREKEEFKEVTKIVVPY